MARGTCRTGGVSATWFRLPLIAGFFLLCATQGESQTGDGSLRSSVRINDEVLTTAQLHTLVTRLPVPLRLDVTTEDGRRRAMDSIIDHRLLLAESLRRGMDRDTDVQARIQAARERILVSAHLDRLVKERVVVNDTQLRTYYAEHREEFKRSEAIRISQIRVNTENEARAVVRDLKRGADFSRLARERSRDPSRKRGGQMGWLERRVMDPGLAAAAFALARSQTSDVVRTTLGYHVIRVDDTRPVDYADFDAVKLGIETRLRRQQTEALLGQVRQDLRRNARILIPAAALQALAIEEANTRAQEARTK